MDVQIRKWEMSDAEALAKVMNNKSVQDNLRDGIPFPYAVNDAKEFISAMLTADANSTFSWAVTVDSTVAGCVGIFRKENVHRLTAEIGYYVAQEFWGKGIMAKAVKAACNFLFNNTDIVRIFAETFSFNHASCRVLEKAGFKKEGTLKNAAVKNGRIVDLELYALVKETIY